MPTDDHPPTDDRPGTDGAAPGDESTPADDEPSRDEPRTPDDDPSGDEPLYAGLHGPPTPDVDPDEEVDLATLLVFPDRFFRVRSLEPSLRGPALLVLTVAAIELVGTLPVVWASASGMPADTPLFVPLLLLTTALGTVLSVFVVWGLFALAFHAISAWFYGSATSWTTTIAFTGWGFLPRLPEAALGAVASVVVFSTATLPDDPDAVPAAVRELQADPLFLALDALGLLFLAWQAVLWTFAMRHGRRLTLGQAARTVAGPVLVAAALLLRGLLGAL